MFYEVTSRALAVDFEAPPVAPSTAEAFAELQELLNSGETSKLVLWVVSAGCNLSFLGKIKGYLHWTSFRNWPMALLFPLPCAF